MKKIELGIYHDWRCRGREVVASDDKTVTYYALGYNSTQRLHGPHTIKRQSWKDSNFGRKR